MKPNQMQSEHPGGYDDIVAAMDKAQIFVPDARGRTIDAVDIIDRYPSGEAATMIHKTLMAHGLYVPGDPEWLTPCKDWKIGG